MDAFLDILAIGCGRVLYAVLPLPVRMVVIVGNPGQAIGFSAISWIRTMWPAFRVIDQRTSAADAVQVNVSRKCPVVTSILDEQSFVATLK
jgi:hypothetical protein